MEGVVGYDLGSSHSRKSCTGEVDLKYVRDLGHGMYVLRVDITSGSFCLPVDFRANQIGMRNLADYIRKF